MTVWNSTHADSGYKYMNKIQPAEEIGPLLKALEADSQPP